MKERAINLFNEQRGLTDKKKRLKMTDFDKFKKFFDDIGIEYKVNNDCLYLDAFASRGGLLIVVDFYENGKFQCFSSYSNDTTEVHEYIKKNR